MRTVDGEAYECEVESATCFFGNRELLISPNDLNESEETYHVSNVRGFWELVRD